MYFQWLIEPYHDKQGKPLQICDGWATSLDVDAFTELGWAAILFFIFVEKEAKWPKQLIHFFSRACGRAEWPLDVFCHSVW